jgi:hypothetical protein
VLVDVPGGPFAELNIAGEVILFGLIGLTGQADLRAGANRLFFDAEMGLDLDAVGLGSFDLVHTTVDMVIPSAGDPWVDARFQGPGIDLTLNRFGCLYGLPAPFPMPVPGGSCDQYVILDDVTFTEPDGDPSTTTDGNRTVPVRVRVTPPATGALDVKFQFAEGSAKEGDDFVAPTSDSVTVGAGDEFSNSMQFTLVGDDTEEPEAETFTIALTSAEYRAGSGVLGSTPDDPVNASSLPTSTVTILDDDAPLGPPVRVIVEAGGGMVATSADPRASVLVAAAAEDSGSVFRITAAELLPHDSITLQYQVVPHANAPYAAGPDDFLGDGYPAGTVTLDGNASQTLVLGHHDPFYEMHER